MENRKEILKQYFEAHFEELMADLEMLVAINSEKMPAKEGKPYGEGAYQALTAGAALMEKYGLSVKNYDNYVVVGDLNEKERMLDILAHLDVVPAGDGWTVTEPFTMKRIDGKVYGRGTSDDKGPALCALYALRALKDLGVELKGNVRLILGSDEECGSSDIAYYYSKEEEAPMSFSPDADYPLIFLEKGGLRSGFTKDFEPENIEPRVVSFQGGVKFNVVPNHAASVVVGLEKAVIEEIARQTQKQIPVSFSLEETLDGVCIHCEGENAHASTPYMGKNAITALVSLLCALPLADCGTTRAFQSVHRLFPYGDDFGHALGVDLEDEISGKTTLAFTIFSLKNGHMEGSFDSRASIAANDENTTDVIAAHFCEEGLVPMEEKMFPPHHVSREGKLVQGLLASYEETFGKTGEPIAIGGGTYVHHISNGVAFGCAVPEVDNHMHGADEFMVEQMILDSCLAMALAILNLCE